MRSPSVCARSLVINIDFHDPLLRQVLEPTGRRKVSFQGAVDTAVRGNE